MAVGSLSQRMKWTDFENRSTMGKMVVFPWDRGRPVTKSTAMFDLGLLGIGSWHRNLELG